MGELISLKAYRESKLYEVDFMTYAYNEINDTYFTRIFGTQAIKHNDLPKLGFIIKIDGEVWRVVEIKFKGKKQVQVWLRPVLIPQGV